MRRKTGAVMAAGLLALTACAGPRPLPEEGADRELTPAAATQRFPEVEGRTVLWGGRVVAIRNLERETRLEILAYPLDGQRPDFDEPARGRFVAVYDGFLEPVDYGAGTPLTVRGNITGSVQGTVGEATYNFPVIGVASMHRWEVALRDPREPRVHFGVGVILGR